MGIDSSTETSFSRLVRVLIVNPMEDGSDPLTSPAPLLENTKLLDPSGTYLLELCVRVTDGSSSTVQEMAVKEAEALVRELEGAIDFQMPDRLALDTRIK